MGTRALTVIKDGDGGEIAVLYRQMDGYPDGHGAELAAFLEGKHLVNGFGLGTSLETTFNGMHCLAAALVAHFKRAIGDFYLYPAGTRDMGEEYIYTVAPAEGADGAISVSTETS